MTARLWRVLVPVSVLALMSFQGAVPAFSDNNYQDAVTLAYQTNAERNRQAQQDLDPPDGTACAILPRDELGDTFAGTGTGNRGSVFRQVEIHPADEAKLVAACAGTSVPEGFTMRTVLQYEYTNNGVDFFPIPGGRVECPSVGSTQVGAQNAVARQVVAAGGDEDEGDCDPLVLFGSSLGVAHSAEIWIYTDGRDGNNYSAHGFALPWPPGEPDVFAERSITGSGRYFFEPAGPGPQSSEPGTPILLQCDAVAKPDALETSVERCILMSAAGPVASAEPVSVPGPAAATAAMEVIHHAEGVAVCWRVSARFVGGDELSEEECAFG